MENKWTPGEWTYERSESWGHCVRAGKQYVGFKMSSAADAKIASASKELYLALEACRQRMVDDGYHSDEIEQADAALAKARGEHA